ncbi:hypothetical protein D910_02091 [Dendroctonus ponderosae]|uniref:Reverse transcriptase domain-containing protein n=1 Tax=Dendroctonus ponderosae TaxID=77166 RepID=U4TT15_DENPD|nr:hypothetical protein D910_02091 [Dendroctonus ponderosae]
MERDFREILKLTTCGEEDHARDIISAESAMTQLIRNKEATECAASTPSPPHSATSECFGFAPTPRHVRGTLLEDWMSANDLVAANRGNTPTFSGSKGKSLIDVTVGERLGILLLTTAEKFSKALSLRVQQFPNIVTPEELMKTITSVGESTLLKRSPTAKRWNKEIAGKRRVCMRLRRKLTRAKKKIPSEAHDIRALKDIHATERKALRSLIQRSKQAKWRELIDDLENIWWRAYQIVKKKFGMFKPPTALDVKTQVEKLFPTFPVIQWQRHDIDKGKIPTFRLEDRAASEIKKKKAPGPDTVPPEVVIDGGNDIALLVKAKDLEGFQDKASYNMGLISKKLNDWIRIAPEKTQIVLGPEAAKYLGVYMDRNMRMTAHAQKTVNKAHGIINAMISLTPKIGGPGAAKKSPLASTVQSVVLYGAKAWQKTLRYKTLLDRVNRRLAICITAAYRTISTQMAQVLAGLPPLDLMVEERSSIQEDGKASRKLHRSTLTRKWTDRWGDYEGWAKVFITDLNVWLQEERFQDVNHFVTQAISGHGAFGSYLKTIRKQESDQCWFCEDSDTPEHTIFVGRQFEGIRAEAADRCGKRITKDAMGTILATKDGSHVIRPMIQDIMKTKCYLERRMQSPWQ